MRVFSVIQENPFRKCDNPTQYFLLIVTRLRVKGFQTARISASIGLARLKELRESFANPRRQAGIVRRDDIMHEFMTKECHGFIIAHAARYGENIFIIADDAGGAGFGMVR